MTSPRLRGMTLTVTERCNLRCGYCYVPVEHGRTMSPGIADAAVDLFLRHAADGAKLDLSFFGGEPFLVPELLERAVTRTRAGGRNVRVATPTNGTLLEDQNLSLCRRHGLELAVSLDGEPRSSDRPFAGGGDSTDRLVALLPGILELDPGARLTARMTVTPANVDELSENVRTLAGLGFHRIVFLPAYELPWGDDAVASWKREHERIGTWLVGLAGTGRRAPDLPTWRGVESRLLLGKPRRACGAGARLAAVSVDGDIYPCYRFVFAEHREEFRLGDVRDGFTNAEALALFAALDPKLAQPEDGDCRTCEARDGCTFFCPALGFWTLRDPLAVPATACRLARAQVEAIRPYAALQPRRAAPRSRSRWAAAVVATAVTGAAAAASCYSSTDDTGSDVVAEASDDAAGDVGGEDGYVGGVCPVGADADADEDMIGPGICAVGPDADADADDDAPTPGECPVPGIC
ncbi:MAG: radical SAM protein [Deltaproteobacteria bacterium]|nr:radical SAM protein [Deltaproteobacteria bacterium]